MQLLRLNKQPHFINDLFSNFFENEFNTISPKENIIENKSAYLIELLIPGISKKEISIDVEDNVLFIKHNLEDQQKTDDVNYLRFGFHKGSFNKKFQLSDKIEQSNITASFENGILTITLPKKEVVKEVRKIKIK